MTLLSSDNPSICIIGAGPCGISAAKNLLEQGLSQFTVFEKNASLGGNWVFDESNTHSSVYETTHIISSKQLSSFEDFPMPDEYPDYPSHAQLLRYFNEYTEHFGVLPFIRFNTNVLAVSQSSNQQWKVEYEDEHGCHEAVFDYLLIANGHHWNPHKVSFPGHFKGDIFHSHEYKRAAPFKGKRVLVVGGGNSACDVAVEVARVANKVCLSIRRGQHIFPKFIFGKPTDVAFAKINWMPKWCKQQLAAVVIRLLQGRYAKYHLKKPNDKPLVNHPTINSELLYFIRHGKIFPRQSILLMKDNDVYFSDGKIDTFDAIILATGYKISFPFFQPDLIDFSELTHLPLYRKMMHPSLHNLYFIGLFQPQGCIWPLADYQAKIAAQIIAGKLKRPAHLPQKIEKEIKQSRQRFQENRRHALEVNYFDFRKQLLKELKGSLFSRALFKRKD